MKTYNAQMSYHDFQAANNSVVLATGYYDTQFQYDFLNFFHPHLGALITQLNRKSLPGLMDADWQATLSTPFFDGLYHPTQSDLIQVTSYPAEIDISPHGPYANYNWELFFHIPLTIAVHLSKNQRFAEAMHWFHYILDPTNNNQAIPLPQRFWKFLGFRQPDQTMRIEDIVRLLSTPRSDLSPDDQHLQDDVMNGYDAIRNKPFQPHAVARTRFLAYQYSVVMKYLDNLIAWGDFLFQQDTIEAINEATQLYVLAANFLGEKPQSIPPTGTVRAQNFSQLKAQLGPLGDALVDLEGQFPFNLSVSNSTTSSSAGGSPLFGIGRTLYFALPRNQKLLGYWDTVADRLFKIRNSMNLAGIVRPLALFDPPIDPGMLVKAAAAGIDISSIVNGLSQPASPLRALFTIQKALELCAEVRNLGSALLAAIEKGDAEHLALVRQRQEIYVQQLAQEVRFLQWKSAQETATSLLTSRATALERMHYYQRLLGLPDDPNAPATITLDHRELTEENFDEAYGNLVGQYDKALATQAYPRLNLAGDTSPAQQAGALGPGRMYLSPSEGADLDLLATATTAQALAFGLKQIAPILRLIPQFPIHIQFWGLGGEIQFGGEQLSRASEILSDIANFTGNMASQSAGIINKTGSYGRRADDWLLQYNLAARDVMQNGRQILTALIAEQVAHHEYLNIQQSVADAQEVDQFLHDKFSNEELHLWMQGEIARIYYEYYRFAFDTARKAERAMKQELMRPEVDSQDFVKFNYWDGGRKGLLSGEALHLDVKRMEMAYYENNKRDLELIKHVSLRQLDPLALLTLKATGSCTITLPEWLFDLDAPGHYMRRIRSIAVSIPCVAGPYTTVACTLTLLKSSIRKSPTAGDDYARQGVDDDRFVDYSGASQMIVTSNAQNDSMFVEGQPRDERYNPFENAGVISQWMIDLPDPHAYPAFDYTTISDVILHVRYTARQGVIASKVKSALDDLFAQAQPATFALLYSLRYDFPTEWAAFTGAKDNAPFSAVVQRGFFPYFTTNSDVTVTGIELYDGLNVSHHHPVGDPAAATNGLADAQAQAFTLTIPEDAAGAGKVMARDPQAQLFVIVKYTLG